MKSFFFSGLFLMMFFSADVMASQGVPMPECLVQGRVVSESYREEKGKGISEGETFWYHDIIIENISKTVLEDSEFVSEPCIVDKAAETEIFQLQSQPNALQRKLKPVPDSYSGKCIQAKNRFFADGNFRSGNWIYDIKFIDDSMCE